MGSIPVAMRSETRPCITLAMSGGIVVGEGDGDRGFHPIGTVARPARVRRHVARNWVELRTGPFM